MLQADPIPTEFFEPASMLTLGGASLVVLVVITALHKVFGVHQVKASFFTSLCIAFAALVIAPPENWLLGVVLSFVNGCLLFCTVAGMHEFATTPKEGSGIQPHGRQSRTWKEAWTTSWLR